MKSTTPHTLPARPGVYRLDAAGMADADQSRPGPTQLLLELGPQTSPGFGPSPAARSIRVLAAGAPGQLLGHPGLAGATVIELPDSVLLPAFVNAHTHLDLTHIGPQPHDPASGFVAWVDRIRLGRAQQPEDIASSVRQGIALSLRGGTVLVGDIAGAPAGRPSTVPLDVLDRSPLRGVSFLEFFAIGTREGPSLALLSGAVSQHLSGRGGARVRLGLQPHAPNTVSLAAYQAAVNLARDHGLPISTHLAETPEEREFIAKGAGPQRAMLERFGLWEDRLLEEIGQGRSPVEHLAPVLLQAPFLAAHVNDIGPDRGRTLEILAATGTSVALCPRASAYFGASDCFGAHAYKEMLRAGINVCLGTDSIVNLPPGVEAANGPGMSVLDEMRLLASRDRADPLLLMAMGTRNGARALGWDASSFVLAPGARPMGVVCVGVGATPAGDSALERVFASREPAHLLCVGE